MMNFMSFNSRITVYKSVLPNLRTIVPFSVSRIITEKQNHVRSHVLCLIPCECECSASSGIISLVATERGWGHGGAGRDHGGGALSGRGKKMKVKTILVSVPFSEGGPDALNRASRGSKTGLRFETKILDMDTVYPYKKPT